MDVVTAYLNDEVEEELYMELPEELEECLMKIEQNGHADIDVETTAKKWLNQLSDGKLKACARSGKCCTDCINPVASGIRSWIKNLKKIDLSR